MKRTNTSRFIWSTALFRSINQKESQKSIKLQASMIVWSALACNHFTLTATNKNNYPLKHSIHPRLTKKSPKWSDDSRRGIDLQVNRNRNTTIYKPAKQSMETVANAFKLKTAGFMASYFCSRTILNALFITLITFVIVPLMTKGSEPESCLLAIIPSLLATMILWFRFTYKYAN